MAQPHAYLLSVISSALILSLAACDDQSQATQGSGRSGTLSNELSPNASILPDPLGENKGRDPSLRSFDQESPMTKSPVVVPRAKPQAFVEEKALAEDTLVRGATGAGYRARARMVWSSSQPAVVHSGEKTVTWPEFQIDLLRELPDLPARLRLVLDSSVFPLGRGTEVRMRADRIGFVVVWPDQRSYRQMPLGTMSALFADRRADRLPFLDEKLTVLESSTRAGQVIVRHAIETSMGRAEMEFAERADLPYAAPLLCQLLLDMVRVLGNVELCPEGKLPLRFSMQWSTGGGFLLEILKYNQEPQLSLDALRIPPLLPIYKRGELPPANDYFLPEPLRNEVFSLKRTGEALAPRSSPGPTVAAPPHQLSAGTEVGLAPDEIIIENTTDRPLIIFLDRIPFVWLSPGEKKSLRVRGTAIHYSARDFWGHVQLEPGTTGAPAHIVLGPSPSAHITNN